jgi:hypothetical protein
MISMKLTPAKAGTMLGDPDGDGDNDQPAYPYGLTICLCDEDLAKLGITDMPAVGSVMQLTALVEVCSVSQYENQDGADNSLSLQITDMELVAGNSEPKSIANRIYGE